MASVVHDIVNGFIRCDVLATVTHERAEECGRTVDALNGFVMRDLTVFLAYGLSAITFVGRDACGHALCCHRSLVNVLAQDIDAFGGTASTRVLRGFTFSGSHPGTPNDVSTNDGFNDPLESR